MPQEITQAQGLWLDLIRLSSFNEFDGVRVVDDLVSHRNLWQSVIMLQDTMGITLRDLPDDYNNVSELLIKTSEAKKSALWDLAKGWGSDKMGWIDNPSGFLAGGEGVVLSVWWD